MFESRWRGPVLTSGMDHEHEEDAKIGGDELLRSLGQLKAYSLVAKDGEFGRTRDFLIDDRYWAVRYLVADTGVWLLGRKVLLSPLFLGEPTDASSEMPVALTRQMLENGPALDQHAPVSRLAERALADDYGFASYWLGTGVRGGHPSLTERRAAAAETKVSTHLRSAAEVNGYAVWGDDREIGEVTDFVADTVSWRIQSLVVDTLPPEGKTRSVLVSPKWVTRVSWADRALEIGLPGEVLRGHPASRTPSECTVSVALGVSSLQPAWA